jgi:hypothetical protein
LILQALDGDPDIDRDTDEFTQSGITLIAALAIQRRIGLGGLWTD